MAEDLYTVRGVPKTADADTIKKAYRKLAKDLHPDKNQGNKKSEDRFKKVNQAFDTLGDPKKRARRLTGRAVRPGGGARGSLRRRRARRRRPGGHVRRSLRSRVTSTRPDE